MLWTLLTAASSATFFAAAVLAAKHARAGPRGYALAVVIGLSLAACNAWTLYKVGDMLAGLTKWRSDAAQNRWGRTVFLAMVLWLPVAAFLGDWVTAAAMRLLS